MTGSPFYRVAAVLVVYAGAAWVVLSAAGWFRSALALPVLFEKLLRGGLMVGVLVALLVAWYYPRLGMGDTSTTRDRQAPGG